MNTLKKGKIIAEVKKEYNSKVAGTIYFDEEYDRDDITADTKGFSQEISLEKDDPYKFFLAFDPKMERIASYVVGESGSGKSWFVRNMIYQIRKLYPEIKVFLISSKHVDPALDDIRGLKRLTIDNSWVENPLQYSSFAMDEIGTLIVFDDIDGFTDQKLKKEIYALRDQIYKNGRSSKLHIISTSHIATGRDNQVPLFESQYITFFLRNYNRQVKYFCEEYLGLTNEQVKMLKKHKTRATTLVKMGVPIYIQEKNMLVLDQI